MYVQNIKESKFLICSSGKEVSALPVCAGLCHVRWNYSLVIAFIWRLSAEHAHKFKLTGVDL
jgi:hypothetical protein